jgi:HlyD family secretion protein
MPSVQEAKAVVRSMHRHALAGLAICLLLIGGFGGWAATAELAGAVIAPGRVVVETDVKKVQHPSGGVVGELRIRDGDRVKAGDTLIRLDETVTRANLAIITKSLTEHEGRQGRLEAERDDADAIVFPEEILKRAKNEPEIAKLVQGEKRLFEARRKTRAGQKAQLSERKAQLRQEIEGLEAQRRAKVEQLGYIRNELNGVEELYRKSLVPLTRLAALQRESARLEGERGQIIASMAQAKGKIAETELQIIQVDQEQRAEVLKELREIEGKLGELTERKVAAEDQLSRIDIRSPQDGAVHQLAVHTIGGVVTAGETLMLIVPQADALTIEAHVAPRDIDQVSVGQPTLVRFSAFNQRTTPELSGTVTRVGADLTKDEKTQGAEAYYTIRIALAEGERDRVPGLKLVPGMPAEVHIQTGERTALSYLLKPLTDQFARALREE